jgi:hypothetical protein
MRIKRYLILKNLYVFDRLIFWVYCAVIIIISVSLVGVFGINNKTYVSCPSDAPGKVCFNPLYRMDCASMGVSMYLCDTETLYAGYVYGEPPNLLLDDMSFLFVLLLGLAFLCNHYWYNMGDKPMVVRITITPLTEKGRLALDKNWKEANTFEMKAKRKLMKVKMEQLQDGSCVTEYRMASFLSKQTWVDMAESVMSSNGADRDDYRVTVVTE